MAKILVSPETPVLFRPSAVGGSGVDFGLTSVASAAGRISARLDLGSSPRSGLYEWRMKSKNASSATAGQALELYLCTSDGTIADANLGTADAAVSEGGVRRNLHWFGSLIVQEATTELRSSGLVYIHARYVSLVAWNATGQALSSTDSDHAFYLTPVPEAIV